MNSNMRLLSPGCQSCQNGNWLCIYLTYRCSASCPFCPAPEKQTDKIVSAFGNDPGQILSWINKGDFTGISFSGGDCFLEYERLLNWVKFFKSNRPDIYYWAYTSGRTVTADQLRNLREAGLDEPRFNIAATGYDHPHIMRILQEASNIFDAVAVEIPSIPQDFNRLLPILPLLEQSGVRYLNLHEYILVPDDPHSNEAVAGTFLLNKSDKLRYDAYSRQNTEKIISYYSARNFKIVINNCSLQQKNQQLLQRRLAMGALLRKSCDRLNADGLYETALPRSVIQDSSVLKSMLGHPDDWRKFSPYFMHPDSEQIQSSKKGWWLIKFLPPLAVDEQRRFYSLHSIQHNEENSDG